MKFSIFNSVILISILIIMGLMFNYNLSWTYLLIPIIVWLLVTSFASFNIQWNFFLKSISKGNSEGNKIALTFDDGPHPEFTPNVLELLELYNAKATFFCIGKNVKTHPEIAQKIIQKGHSIGNHSFSHSPWIDFKDKRKWMQEIESTDEEIYKITGKKPQFFRPPFGITTPHLAKALRKTQHQIIGWDVRSFDTVSKENPKQVVTRILNKTKPGSIILMHDHLPKIVPILEQLLPELQKRNFTFVTVDELINSKPYEST